MAANREVEIKDEGAAKLKGKKAAEEKVAVMIPYIEGEPEEVNVTVNGVTIQVMRGETVEIPKAYAEVLENQAKQAKFFRGKQAELKEQVTVED